MRGLILFFLILIPFLGWTDKENFLAQVDRAEKLIHTEVDSATRFIELLEHLPEVQSNIKWKFEIDFLKVKLTFAQGDFNQSMILSKELLKKSSNVMDLKFQLRVLKALGNTYNYTALKPEALELNQRIYSIATYLKDTSSMVWVLNSFGDVYKNSEEHDKCYDYFLKAFALAQLSKNPEDLAWCSTYLGTYHLTKQTYDSSFYYLWKANAYFDKSYYKDQSCLIWIRLGRTYNALNELDSAEYCIRQSNDLSKKIHSPLWMGRSFVQLGIIEDKRGNYGRALSFFDSAQYNVTKAQDLIVQQVVLQFKTNTYSKLGQTDSAFALLQKHIQVKDSVQSRMNHEMIVNMKWDQALEKKEDQILYLKEKSDILDSRNRAQRRFRIWLFIGLAAMTVLTILVFKLLQQRNKSLIQEKKFRNLDNEQAKMKIEHERKIREMQEKTHLMELELKNRELTTLVMEIGHKSQDIQEIHKKIKTVEETIKPDSKLELNMLKELRGISKQLITETGKEKEWQQFKLQFEQVHSSFFENLKNAHPDLTAYDLKLCAYFHMNLGIKQVSNILSVSYDAVKKQRTRMRKKMGLDETTNLLSYLNKMTKAANEQ